MTDNDNQSDRERILMNIAGMLAQELAAIQSLLMVKDYVATRGVRAQWHCKDLKKGDLVACSSSVGRQQNPWIVSIVEQVGIDGDPFGCALRAIGTDDLCNYGNESFTKIIGIPERLLWEGDKRVVDVKIHAALRELDDYKHRLRGLRFDENEDGVVYVFVGPHIFYMDQANPVKPYRITIRYDKETSVDGIVAQMEEQGFGVREFEPDDGTYDGPMGGCATFTRQSLLRDLKAAGISIGDNVHEE